LWHGPGNQSPDLVLTGKKGFQSKGLTFALEASFADRFAHIHQDGVRGIFLAAVLLGEVDSPSSLSDMMSNTDYGQEEQKV
jgi:hypothetical protein